MNLYVLKSIEVLTNFELKLDGLLKITPKGDELWVCDAETGRLVFSQWEIAYWEADTAGTLTVYMTNETVLLFSPIEQFIPNLSRHDEEQELELLITMSEEQQTPAHHITKRLLVFNREVKYPELKLWCNSHNMLIATYNEVKAGEPYVKIRKMASNTYSISSYTPIETEETEW